MLEDYELEEMVITIRNKTSQISERVMDEQFAEAIEDKLHQLPSQYRDEFMRIAGSYGYTSPSERQLSLLPESEGFDDDLYDMIFPLGNNHREH